MRGSNEKLEPILVMNPETERYVNIAPLLDIVNSVWQGEFTQVGDALDAAAVDIACCADQMDAAPNDIGGVMYELFRLRDVFYNIAEFKEDRRR